ncbi:MAG: winged helix-turn-helix transcriptional regulator, partial [Candidatus Thermoplasmatota archaeon]
SSYIGNIIKIRFRLVSDDAFNATGWYIDDISVIGELKKTKKDVGVVSFSIESAEIYLGDKVGISAIIENYGDDIITNLSVKLTILGIDNTSYNYTDIVKIIALEQKNTTIAKFNWNAPKAPEYGYNYTISVETILIGDEKIENDKKSREIRISPDIHDVGVVFLSIDAYEAKVAEERDIIAMVTNLGNFSEQNISLKIIIMKEDGTVVYNQTQIIGLLAKCSMNATWNWTPVEPGKYLINVSTNISLDSQAINNERNVQIVVLKRENGITKLKTPINQRNSLLIATTFCISLLLLCLGPETTRYSFFKFFLPIFLYSRKAEDEILDNEIRGKIYLYILSNPGASYGMIKRGIAVGNGTLTYHLQVLQQWNQIDAKNDGIFKRFYPKDMKVVCGYLGGLSVREKIINIIKASPGISQNEIARRIGMSKQVVNYHIRILVMENKLRVLGKGRKSACYYNNARK